MVFIETCAREGSVQSRRRVVSAAVSERKCTAFLLQLFSGFDLLCGCQLSPFTQQSQTLLLLGDY